jgi:hypothetical protein
MYNLPGGDQIMEQLIQAAGKICINSVWKREELPDQLRRKSITCNPSSCNFSY